MMQINPIKGVGQQRSQVFSGIKFTLIVLQIWNIIGSILLIAFDFIALGVADAQKEEDPQIIRKAGIIVIVSDIIAILLCILGLFGAIIENFNLIVTYGVIITIIAIRGFAVQSWWSSVVSLIVAFIAFYFAYLINKKVVANSVV